MHTIPITKSSSSVETDQYFSITLTEPDCINCSWLTNIPSSVTLVDLIHHTKNSSPKTEWIFICDTPGIYTLEFFYRKHCCGKPILKQATYTISISSF